MSNSEPLAWRFANLPGLEDALLPLRPVPGGILCLDQTRLPFAEETVLITTPHEMSLAVKHMKVRGSGAIGIAGAFGAYQAVAAAPGDPLHWDEHIASLREARSTAIILRLAIDEVLSRARMAPPSARREAAAIAAIDFFVRQLDAERAIGAFGSQLLPDECAVLTHCNSGALAGAGYGGRALSVIRAAYEAGKRINVFSQETRPYLQGARITAWELQKLGIPVTLISDGMAGALMQMGLVDVCIVGSDRLASNGDLVNKVGTYMVALASAAHDLPFYTATSRYNVDLACPSGEAIPIEFRPGEELLEFAGRPISSPGIAGLYPAFDITPAHLITGIITELGVLRPPFEAELRKYANSVDRRIE